MNFDQSCIRSLHLLLALLQPDAFGLRALTLKALEPVSLEALQAQVAALKPVAAAGGGAAPESAPRPPAAPWTSTPTT
ncbi:hypothetical protein [Marinobacterium aestuariivivens]|uniref:Clp R domain-containing protein n=1 Tax=Marinobacterium aestuariivivens TaxID=1698799 RepID=A0ABW1ZZP3_9GAMM